LLPLYLYEQLVCFAFLVRTAYLLLRHALSLPHDRSKLLPPWGFQTESQLIDGVPVVDSPVQS
jgi:hypothetical protein